jgi:AraC-like DNA-binding protein
MHDVGISTVAGLSAPRCFESFRAAVSEAVVPVVAHTRDEAGFRGRVTRATLGPLHLAEVSAGAHVVRRTSRLLRGPEPDFYKLSLLVEGRGVLVQDGRDAVLRPGDLALYDTTRPYELHFDGHFRMIVLMFRRSLLRIPEESVRGMTGRRICGDEGLGLLIGPFLAGLAGQMDRRASSVDIRLADAVLDMLAAALIGELDASGLASPRPHQAILLTKIKAYIEERLADRELDQAGIAEAHHISTRYVRKLFEAEGDSVGRWIRGRRLERCRQDLSLPELGDQPVSTVAAHWCLTDPAYFSRLFKAAYGRSPRAYRQAMARPAPAAIVSL